MIVAGEMIVSTDCLLPPCGSCRPISSLSLKESCLRLEKKGFGVSCLDWSSIARSSFKVLLQVSKPLRSLGKVIGPGEKTTRGMEKGKSG